ncbi:MAG: hypothetical protein ABDH37_04010 [Candidatus Hydrothermales bacterium]
MKGLIEKLKSEFSNIEGIVLCDLIKDEVLEKEGRIELFEEGILLIGSTTKLTLEKNIGKDKFDLIEIELKTGEIINLFMKENILAGVIGERIDKDKVKKILMEFKPLEVKEEVEEIKVEKEEVKEYIPTPEEKLAINKIEQINELVKEFAPGDEERWLKVSLAKIKDSSPELAELISLGEKELKIDLPFKVKLNEDEINKAFRTSIDIIWKMAVSKYGIDEARKKVKKVAEKLKLI